jgi:two-component system, OmpR family, sensor histidine kinase ChvG
MTLAPKIDLQDSAPAPVSRQVDLLLGDDWVSTQGQADSSLRRRRGRRGLVSLKNSPLARKIVVFNLLALLVLVVGVLLVNPFRDGLVLQREQGMVNEARLIASIVKPNLATSGDTGTPALTASGLVQMGLAPGSEVFVFDAKGTLVAQTPGALRPEVPDVLGRPLPQNTAITDALNWLWEKLTLVTSFGRGSGVAPLDPQTLAVALVPAALAGEATIRSAQDATGSTLFSVAVPVRGETGVIGVVAVSSAAGEIDLLVRNEREQILRIFTVALMVSIALSLVLASTIANPLRDLAAAAELGRDRNARKMAPGRVRIPDLTARPDEIGRLSVALRGMVSALYDRIEANEQFAADVAHEIKNPLASLRSAVGTMRVAKRDDQREKLLTVIEHDVRRLDRLVSDISNASRLDSELVKEEEQEFDLVHTISNINQFLSEQAQAKGVDYITDLPQDPVLIHGLEGRLAQVFVNLITNAISFCEDGDAVRVWARKRDNRVLIVVEDTGPGIPEQALSKVFKRFYSDRPAHHFGNNSGLGLSISKQIVEAHGGVIWAENIRPTQEDVTSEPLGARFVVGLPV